MIPQPISAEKAAAQNQIRIAGGWLNAIALFSVINTVLFIVKAKIHFVIGMGITEIIDDIGTRIGGGGIGIAVFMDVIVVGVFAGLGAFAKLGKMWAFIVGMVFYAIDTALVVLIQDWFSAAFHAYVLFRTFAGIQGCMALKAVIERERRQQPVAVAAQPGVWPPPPGA